MDPIKKDLTEELEGPSEAGFHFIQDWKRCQRYWGWTYYYGIEPINPSPVLLYGIAMHEAMEAWLLALMHNGNAFERVNDAKNMFQASLVGMKQYYLFEDTWAADLAKGFQTLEEYGIKYNEEHLFVEVLPDKTPCLEMSCKATTPHGDKFTGRVDGVVRNAQGVRYIIDHKTTGWAISMLERTLRVSNQATGYLWLWNETYPDLKANAVIFNVLRNSKGSIDFARPVVYKTPEDIERFKRDTDITLNEIAEHVAVEDPFFTMNTDSCFKYNKACPFLECCQGSNYELHLGEKFKLRGDAIK